MQLPGRTSKADAIMVFEKAGMPFQVRISIARGYRHLQLPDKRLVPYFVLLHAQHRQLGRHSM
jgi:hypothetical protein